MSRHGASSSEGIAGATGSKAYLSDLDRLAGETRDTGQLLEALPDSVLDYTLRRLKPDAKAGSCTFRVLEKTLRCNDLSQLMNEDSTSPQNSLALKMRLDETTYSAAADQGNSFATGVCPASGTWDKMGSALMPSLQSNGYNWWDLNVESNKMPILSYEELFNMDFGI